MRALTSPQARIPLGWAMVNGQKVPVLIDMEWARYLSVLNERAGGVTGPSTTDASVSSFEDAGVEETKSAVYDLWTVLGMTAEINELRARVDELTKLQNDQASGELSSIRAAVDNLYTEIQALQQGSNV